jgi:hypothetical protein
VTLPQIYDYVSMTILWWMRPNATTWSAPRMIWKTGVTDCDASGLRISVAAPYLIVNVGSSTYGASCLLGVNTFNVSIVPADMAWHQYGVAIDYYALTRCIYIYRDGHLISRQVFTAHTAATTGTTVFGGPGATSNMTNSTTPIVFAHLAIYNNILNSHQVYVAMGEVQKQIGELKPVAYYQFTQNSMSDSMSSTLSSTCTGACVLNSTLGATYSRPPPDVACTALCAIGQHCYDSGAGSTAGYDDCTSNYCWLGLCRANLCFDGMLDGSETGNAILCNIGQKSCVNVLMIYN